MEHLELRDVVTEYIRSGIKSEKKKLIGMEAEHFILNKETGEALPYDGKISIKTILTRLLEKIPGSTPIYGEDLLGLNADGYIITIEPAAQLEISIAAFEDIKKIEDVYLGFLDILNKIIGPMGCICLSVGTQPVSKVRELKLIPKERYRLMNAHFERVGNGGIEMMRGTCSLQASVDFFSEEDFRRKIQAVSIYMPIFKLFADNAPMFEGKKNEIKLKRTDIWNRTDSKRCGILPGVLNPDYGFSDYADFLLAMPPIFKETEAGDIPTGDLTVDEVYGGKSVSKEELTHIFSMAFPDIRVKHYLEIRGADAMPSKYAMAYCALVKALVYSEESLDFAQKLIKEKGLKVSDIKDAEYSLMKKGWNAVVYGENVKDLASALLDMGARHLSADETGYLEPLRRILEEEKIPFELDCEDGISDSLFCSKLKGENSGCSIPCDHFKKCAFRK